MPVLSSRPAGRLVLALAASLLTAGAPAGDVRPPAVAGAFYPGDAAALGLAVDALLGAAPPPRGLDPVAIVVPHAGYVYSGAVAAQAFREAEGRRPDVVVILGTNHTVPGFAGAALSPASGFRTPLGVVPVDAELAAALKAACRDCVFDARPHAQEHSIEVEVPFVQRLWPQASILPVVVGAPDVALCRRVGAALASVLRGKRALVVASSDLSHYPAAEDATRVDARTLQATSGLDPAALHAAIEASMAGGVPNLLTGACGEAPVMAAMAAARALGATRGVVLRYLNSGQTGGDTSRVVGYGAVAFVAAGPAAQGEESPEGRLAPEEGRALVALARQSIADYAKTRVVSPPAGALPGLASVERGVFVTLRERGELRGCIGRIVPDEPLPGLVARMAVAAAFEDPRFPPLAPGELDRVELELSVLTPPHPVVSPSAIVPGRDGVVLQAQGTGAVFLPQVATEQGWGREALLDNLCRKAGLAATCWRAGARLSVFQAQVIPETRP